jgi:hypothetical protein
MISSMGVWLASLACSSLRGYSFLDIFSKGCVPGTRLHPLKVYTSPRVQDGETIKRQLKRGIVRMLKFVRRLISWIEGRKGGVEGGAILTSMF